ncbi:MAG TPA: PAS domain-containing protein [Alphaproteobacteria bacterium]|nr:PAS domain-containing protein [Alphaproteobacteria bacterium]
MKQKQNGPYRGLIRAQAGIQRQRHAGGSFVATVERLHVPIVITDSAFPIHPIIFSNNAFLRLIGYSLGEVLSRSFQDFMGPDVDLAVMALLDDAFEKSEEAEIRLYRNDGWPIWVSIFVSPILDSAGTAIQRTVSFLDVSRRRAAEDELRRSNIRCQRKFIGI